MERTGPVSRREQDGHLGLSRELEHLHLLGPQKEAASYGALTMDINLFEDNDEDTRQIQMLYKRIHQLKPFDRAIVLLWLENMSYEEIAAIVGITVKNVSVRLYRIKEQLKQMSN